MEAGKSEVFCFMEPLCTKKPRRGRSMGKSSRTSSMNEVMKPQIWKKIPEDLLQEVLARLPFTIILRFRTVCRQWNNLLSSISFFQHCTQVPQAHEHPWFYITFGNNNYEAMYDPLMKRWYCSIAKLPKLPICGLPVSSVGGLVCLQDTFLNMYICNPLTRSFKILPKSNKNWLHSGMTMNESGGYRVLQFGGREYEIYDSVTKCWSHVRKIPATVTCHCVSNSISIDTTLYIRRVYPDGIVSCDTSTGVLD
jgi:hypothetical protein